MTDVAFTDRAQQRIGNGVESTSASECPSSPRSCGISTPPRISFRPGDKTMRVVTDSTSDHGHQSFKSITPLDATMLYLSFMSVRGFISTVPPAFSIENPAGGYVPKADSLFDVGIETSASHIGHVERGASHEPALARAMHHFLEQRQARFDRHTGLRKPDGNDRFREIGALAHAKRFPVQASAGRPFASPRFPRASDRKSRRR